jgi:hypothetical protein
MKIPCRWCLLMLDRGWPRENIEALQGTEEHLPYEREWK